MSLFEQFFTNLSLHLEDRIRIRIRVKSLIWIKQKSGSASGSTSKWSVGSGSASKWCTLVPGPWNFLLSVFLKKLPSKSTVTNLYGSGSGSQWKRLTPGSGEESGSLLRALDCPRMLRQPVPSLPCTTSIKLISIFLHLSRHWPRRSAKKKIIINN